jgi:hypothetical protein
VQSAYYSFPKSNESMLVNIDLGGIGYYYILHVITPFQLVLPPMIGGQTSKDLPKKR